MKRKGLILVGDAEKKVIRIGESVDGTWTFLMDGEPCGWCRRTSGGRWMLFRNSYVRFFSSLNDLMDCVDREVRG